MSRGEYAAIHTAILDDPAFQDLSASARLLWYSLRLLLGASGIDILRGWQAVLPEVTGLEDPAGAMQELESGGWLLRQHSIFWLRNALRFNPSLNLSNLKHKKGLTKHLEGLPKCEIVNAFADYYGLERPFSGMGIEWVSNGYAIPVTRSHGHTVTGTGSSRCSEPDASADVENSETGPEPPPESPPADPPKSDPWGDFAGWYRTTGHRLLWQDDHPPPWATKDGRPWTLARDLDVIRALMRKGESLDTIRGVIERNREPSCMLHFNQAGRWDYWYRAKEELRKAEEGNGKRVSAILRGIVKAGVTTEHGG
jgi:hypothetical protein